MFLSHEFLIIVIVHQYFVCPYNAICYCKTDVKQTERDATNILITVLTGVFTNFIICLQLSIRFFIKGTVMIYSLNIDICRLR